MFVTAHLFATVLSLLFTGFSGGGLPDKPEEFGKRYDLPKIQREIVAGIEVWSEDAKLADGTKPLVEGAMKYTEKWLGLNPLKGKKVRVILLKDVTAFEPILKDFNEEIVKAGGPAVDATYISQAKAAGACNNSNPMLVLVSSRVISSRFARESRIIHELGHFVAHNLISEGGLGPPALVEGIAGEIVRAVVPKPEGVVCAISAALTETTHGYGVFGGIGSIVNDASNDPNAWPRMLQNVVKAWHKHEAEHKTDPAGASKAQVAALLGRKNADFTRADYGYAWSVCNYLFDKNSKPKAGDPVGARRDLIIKALSAMRKEYDTAGTMDEKIDFFQKRLLETLQTNAADLQKDWLNWADKAYSKL